MAGIDFKSLTSALNQRFSQMNGASPFKSTALTGGSPFSSSTLGGGASPFKQPFGNLQSPFQNPLGGAKSPFNNPFGNVQSPFGGFGQVNSPFGGNPFSTPMNPFRPQSPNGLPSGDDSPLYEGGEGGFTGTSDGSGDEGTQKWRPLIEDVARELGIADPDVLQAVMMIESGGVDGLTSPDGAIGLMQVVPKYHAQRVKGSLWEPRNNIYAGAQFLKELYQRYGSWDKAAAGYLGGMNADGTFNNNMDSHGTTGAMYAEKFNKYMAQLKAAGVRDVPGTSGGTSWAPRANWEQVALSYTKQGGNWVDYTNGGIRNTGNPADGMDCSSFTGYVLGLDRGLWNAQLQYDAAKSKAQTFTDIKQARKGDLIFFQGTNADDPSARPVSHVGIYLGNGKMIHTGQVGKGVVIINVADMQRNFYAFGRIPR